MVSGLKNIETIESPFRRFVTTIGVFPTAFTDAMTYYECLAYLVKYLDVSVVPAINENAEALKELQDYVVHYFDNLDVQDEINNKLDEMAEDGTLQEIITSYIQNNVTWTFDTVADMKQATNLISGSFARTLGFYAVNDEGGATYYITDTGTANEMDVIAVGDLYANLIIEDNMNVSQFGAKGDNNISNNEQEILNTAINCGASTITFGRNRTYFIKGFIDSDTDWQSTSLQVPSNTEIDLNGSAIKVIPNGRDWYIVFDITTKRNVTIRNGSIYGEVTEHSNTGSTGQFGYGVNIINSQNICVDNLIANDFWGDSFIIYNSQNTIANYCRNITIKNCSMNRSRRQGISILDGDGILVEDCTITNIGTVYGISPKSGIDIEPDRNGTFVNNVTIQRCRFDGNVNTDIVASHNPAHEVTIDNVTIRDCTFNQSVYLNDVFNCTVENNDFNGQKLVALCLFESMKFTGNRLVGSFAIYTHSSTNDSCAIIENNTIESNVTTTDSSMFLVYDPSNTATGYKGKVLISNNILRGTNSSSGRCNGIKVQSNSTIQKIVIDNNEIKLTDTPIEISSIPCIVKNNTIIRGRKPTVFVGTEIKVITNNEFYQSSETYMAPYVLQVKATNLLLKHNTYYPVCLNSADNEAGYNALTRWIDSTEQSNLSGYSELDDNVILTSV